jgi:predicted RNase H-like nuclease (RuvC/YqgF family)
MNYVNMTPKELVHYLDLYSEDPVVRRLVEFLRQDTLVEDLVEVGMDPDNNTFRYDGYQDLPPSDYIRQLRNDADFYEREADDKSYEIENLNKEINRLSTKSLVSFIADVQQTLETAKMEEGRHRRIAEHEKKLREEAEQKFEFWEKMNHGIR